MGKNKRLIGYRKMAGFSQDDMAKFTCMDRTTYFRKENGKASFTDLEMKSIYDVLSINLKQVIPELKITDIFF